jgi:hypothetical protein
MGARPLFCWVSRTQPNLQVLDVAAICLAYHKTPHLSNPGDRPDFKIRDAKANIEKLVEK